MESQCNQVKTVDPLTGLAPWVGGKRCMAKRLAERIDGTPHHCYCEPFIGMGGVFLARRQAPKVEVINDFSGDVVNLFRVVQHHPEPLAGAISGHLFSRETFKRLLATPPDTLTDINRAARFYFLQRARFGGKPDSTSFPVTPIKGKSIRPEVLRRFFQRVGSRLAQVTIEHLPYRDMITRYDRPGTLFYLDPPYWGCEDYYGKDMFSREDFQVMATQLATIKGRFLLSINDHPEVRRIFNGFHVEEIETKYSIRRHQRVVELLISNRR